MELRLVSFAIVVLAHALVGYFFFGHRWMSTALTAPAPTASAPLMVDLMPLPAAVPPSPAPASGRHAEMPVVQHVKTEVEAEPDSPPPSDLPPIKATPQPAHPTALAKPETPPQKPYRPHAQPHHPTQNRQRNTPSHKTIKLAASPAPTAQQAALNTPHNASHDTPSATLSAATAPVHLTKQPLTISCKAPRYPDTSKALGETGAVLVMLYVSADGTVTKSHVQKSSGHSRLDQAALQALSRCIFKPGQAGGHPVATWTAIRYVWQLK